MDNSIQPTPDNIDTNCQENVDQNRALYIFYTSVIIKRLKQKSVGDKTKLWRVMFLVTSVVLIFAVCFLPYAFTRAVQLKISGLVMKEEKVTVVKLYDGLVCLSYLNCLLNPILYCLSSSKFKKLYISIYLPFLLEKEQPESSEDTADD
ncbi:12-(S)-hydroxy-5,8,10,14-eicosatetraenoic acid receptor-like [Sinocyclocheilus anshuiensis]|uniref:12-(S)-hydroxy-5,8,10,14-eicosatetraenoic acid receptor-like n=1 Tax=Sinocyclocheilus anshuiensis TaxID=1608454 RepID=UPI0007BA5D9B|nr:PREDICTED: 12-(S)-hydroxy-5,8,10,14-eicosatetraenoic acid receptor-like [Sinocyclocheilus anshuiensis]